MTLRIPGIALALSLLFLLQRERPGLTLRSAAQILGGGATACAATLFWVQITDGTDFARTSASFSGSSSPLLVWRLALCPFSSLSLAFTDL
jgi:hypothetical protein